MTTEEILVRLRCGAKSLRCGIYLHRLEPMRRQSIYHELEEERLNRKYEEIRTIYNDSCEKDWNRVMLSLLFRVFSDSNEQNKRAYAKLGTMFDYKILARERGSVENIEAMFIVASGIYRRKLRTDDSYARSVVKNGKFLLRKYGIEEMNIEEWSLQGLRCGNEPVVRFSQLAELICRNDMLFNKIKSIRSRDEVLELFALESRGEWSRYFSSGGVPIKIGVDKRDMIGINFVVPMLYAVGSYFGEDELCYSSRDLNEEIPAESNGIISKWRAHGLTPTIAYETQALLELANSYCKGKGFGGVARCEECHLFRDMMGNYSILAQVPKLLEV